MAFADLFTDVSVGYASGFSGAIEADGQAAGCSNGQAANGGARRQQFRCFARSYSKNGSQSKIVGMFETEQAEFALALHHDSSFPG